MEETELLADFSILHPLAAMLILFTIIINSYYKVYRRYNAPTIFCVYKLKRENHICPEKIVTGKIHIGKVIK